MLGPLMTILCMAAVILAAYACLLAVCLRLNAAEKTRQRKDESHG